MNTSTPVSEGLTPGSSVQPAPCAQLWQPDRLVLDFDPPYLEIARALRNLDEAALWAAYRTAPDPEIFVDWLSRMAGSYVRKTPHWRDPDRMTAWNHCLFAGALVLDGPPMKFSRGANEPVQGMDTVLPELQAWVGKRNLATLARDMIDYEAICQWSPVYQYQVLQQLAGEAHIPGPHAQGGPEFQMPPGLPHLTFILASVGSWLDWPELPEEGAPASHSLGRRIAGAAAYLSGRAVSAQSIVEVHRFPQAITRGLIDWITALAHAEVFDTWRIDPATPDRVVLTLSSSEDPQLSGVIPMRLHQLGTGAMDLITQHLWSEIGPCEEHLGRNTRNGFHA